MGNTLLVFDSNPRWNNLPSEHVATECRDLDDLLALVRSYGGPGEEDEDGEEERGGKKEDKTVLPPPNDLTPPAQKKSSSISPINSKKIHPEQKYAVSPTSSLSPSQSKRSGKTLVSLR